MVNAGFVGKVKQEQGQEEYQENKEVENAINNRNVTKIDRRNQKVGIGEKGHREIVLFN